MAKTKPRTCDFIELGQKITALRREKYRSVLALFREIDFSFSYRAFSEFESGQALPKLEQLLEIVEALKVQPQELVLLWAKVQMPNETLRGLFLARSEPEVSPTLEGRRGPNFENTWVFGKAEYDFLIKEPWFFGICLKLALAYPAEVTFKELGLANQVVIEKFIGLYLEPWIILKRISRTESGIRAVDPNVHIPNTESWNEIRRGNFQSAYENIDIHKNNYHEIMTRGFNQEQADYWINELRKVESKFRTLQVQGTKGELRPYSMLMVFGSRSLDLPAEIIERCKRESK